MGMTFDLCWVRVLPCGEQAVVRYNHKRDVSKIVPLSELPEDILRKMAVLKMVNVGEDVDGVGSRLAPQSFLIYF